MTWYGVDTLKRQDYKKNKRYTIHSNSSSRLLMPRGSIVLALWITWASLAFLNESRPFLKAYDCGNDYWLESVLKLQ